MKSGVGVTATSDAGCDLCLIYGPLALGIAGFSSGPTPFAAPNPG